MTNGTLTRYDSAMTNQQIEVLVIDPDGVAEFRLIEPTWQGIKAIIDGWLEAVGGDGETWIAYGDEEGRMKNLPINPGAGLLMKSLRPDWTVLPVGTVVIAGLRYAGPEDGYTDANVPDTVKEAVLNLSK